MSINLAVVFMSFMFFGGIMFIVGYIKCLKDK